MSQNGERREFFKYLLSLLTFFATSVFSFKFNKSEGFKIGKRFDSFGVSNASGICGSGMGCAGGGGQCGSGMGCAGGGGQCGSGMGCAGS